MVVIVRSVSGCCFVVFFFQAEDGIRDLVRSRGLGDVYKRQVRHVARMIEDRARGGVGEDHRRRRHVEHVRHRALSLIHI